MLLRPPRNGCQRSGVDIMFCAHDRDTRTRVVVNIGHVDDRNGKGVREYGGGGHRSADKRGGGSGRGERKRFARRPMVKEVLLAVVVVVMAAEVVRWR